ncbi:GIP, partial [Symbiodinium sp. CCMP2456]
MSGSVTSLYISRNTHTTLRKDVCRPGTATTATFDVCYVDEDVPGSEDARDKDEPLHEAYPLRAWQTPGEGSDGELRRRRRGWRQGAYAMSTGGRVERMAEVVFVPSRLPGRAPDDERLTSIFMRPPDDPVSRQAMPEWLRPDFLYKLSAPIYGQADAPRRWYIHVRKVLTELGWIPHTLDPCLFLLVEKVQNTDTVVGVPGLHVDDLIRASLNGLKRHLDAAHASFTWGKAWDSKASYVSEVPVTKAKLEPTERLSDHPELITEVRSGVGRPAGDQRGFALRRYVKATIESFYKIVSVPWSEMMLVVYGDSGFGNTPNGKSQGGLVVVATTKRAEDYGNFLAAMLSEMRDASHQATMRARLIEVIPVTEKRVEISIAALGQQCRNLRWVPTEMQMADAVTKRNRALRDRMDGL